jgi:capsular polysaccharide biosynthesis protein
MENRTISSVTKTDLRAVDVAEPEMLYGREVCCWTASDKQTVCLTETVTRACSNVEPNNPFWPFFSKEFFSSQALDFCSIPDVVYHNNTGLVQIGAQRVWRDSAAGFLWQDPTLKTLAQSGTLDLAEEQADAGCYLLFTHGSYTNFGHYLIDCCAALLPFLPDLKLGRLKLASSPLWFNWQREILSLLSVPQNSIFEIRKPHRFQTAICPSSHTTSSTRFPHALVPRLFSNLRKSVADVDITTSLPELVYLKRTGTGRQLEHEDQVEQRLCAMGFTIISPESHSVCDQIRLMSRARVMVGVYGAGLLNIGFSNVQVHVLEIRPDVVEDPWTMHLAARLGHRYACFVCRTEFVVGRTQSALSLEHMRLRFDLEDFFEVVGAVLRLEGVGRL